jgi:methionyl-tRNA synthetase
VDTEHLERIGEHAARVTEHLEGFRFRAGMAEILALARASNVYLDRKQPWRQRAADPAGAGTTLNVCLQSVRALVTLSAPFLPFSSAKGACMLGLSGLPLPWGSATEELPEGQPLGEPEPLFPRIEPEEWSGAAPT